jgi:MFS family permease
MLSIGQFDGWAAPSLPKLMRGNSTEYPAHLTSEEVSWVVTLYIIAAMAGSIVCAFIVNIIGRKHTMLLATIPAVISWLLIAFATLKWVS